MSEFKSSNFTNEDNSGGPDLVGVTTFTSPYYFVPPSGTTAERPSGDGLAPGMLRFNTDIGRLEVWRGDHWATILGVESAPLGTRGLIAGGDSTGAGGDTNVIQYITLSTTGNSVDFGDLIRNQRHACGNVASTTRGCFGGGYLSGSGGTNTIEYVTISTLGNSIDFGDRAGGSTWSWGGLSDSTRGLWVGFTGPLGLSNSIDYITITSTGNSQDFGDHSVTSRDIACLSSTTRGIMGGDYVQTNTIAYVTISSTGNAVDFGDLTFSNPSGNIYGRATGSNGIRGIFGPHGESPVAKYQYITISTLGDSVNFGDALVSNHSATGSSGKTRMFSCGTASPVNNIDYVTITTTGNAQDFGDLTALTITAGALSNAHGGL